METAANSFTQIGSAARHIGRRLLIMGENRLELLMVELQEERGRLLQALLLTLWIGALGLLAGMALSAAIVVLLWAWSPVGVLLALTGLYAAAGILIHRRLAAMLRTWNALAASLDQLRKDRACLREVLS